MGINNAVQDLWEALDSTTDPLRRLTAWALAGRELLDDALGHAPAAGDPGEDPGSGADPIWHPMPPVRVAFLISLLRDVSNLTGYGLVAATGLAGLAPITDLDSTQLTELDAMRADLPGYVAGDIDLPDEAAALPTGKRLFRSTDEYLQKRMLMGSAETTQLLDGAALLLPRPTPEGPALPARYPLLAKTLSDGDADPRAAVEAARRMRNVEPTLARGPDPETALADFEKSTNKALRTLTPRLAKKAMDELAAAIVPDGEPDTAELKVRQGLFFRGWIRGLSHFEAYCDAKQTESLLNVFDLVDNLNLGRKHTRTPFTGASGTGPGTTPEPGPGSAPAGVPAPDWAVAPGTAPQDRPTSDTSLGIDADGGLVECDPADRTIEQRHLDALTDACQALGRTSGADPSCNAGDPALRSRARIVVHIAYETLAGNLDRSGRTAHGNRIPTSRIRQLACMGDIVPAVFGGAGEILDYGRSRRLFSTAQLQAMAARDGGCVWPGCPVPAARAEGHHMDPWSGGGETNIGNAALFCDHHHHLIHVGAGRLIFFDGVPYVVPPPGEDSAQRPVRNLYWHPELLNSTYAPTLPGLGAPAELNALPEHGGHPFPGTGTDPP